MAGSPTVLKRRLGAELRNLRQSKQLTAARVSKALGWSESKVSRIESGKSPLSDKDAKLLLSEYGIEDPQEVRQFVDLVRRSRQNGWWHSFGDALPEWFRPYLGFEQDAVSIWMYHNELVPGLLQTHEYAQAIIRTMEPDFSADEVEARASARVRRQDILTSETPPKVWAVLNEAVLRRVVGSPAVMRDQLTDLVEKAEGLPNLTVQVLPFDAGAHASMGYSFSHLAFEDVPGAVVYAEGIIGGTYFDKPADLSRHASVFQQLMATAERPEKSVNMIRESAEEYRRAD